MRSAVLCFWVGSSLPGSARAGDPPKDAAADYARDLFEQAESAMRNTPPDYDAACEGFRKAYEVAHGLGALKKQAVCEEARGKLATALALWKQAAGLPQAADRKAESDKQVSVLEERVGRFRIEAPSSSEKVSVAVDGASWPVGQAGPIDAGSHRVVFERTDRDGRLSTHTVDVTVINGATATTRWPEAAGEQAPPGSKSAAAPDASDSGSGLRVAGFVVGGLGVAGFVAFGVTGGLVLSTSSALQDSCRNHESEPYSGCNAEAPGLVSRGDTLNVVNAVSLGVGVVAVGVAIPLLVAGYDADGPPTSAVVLPWVDTHSAGLLAGGSF